jgi:hypothetical protein
LACFLLDEERALNGHPAGRQSQNMIFHLGKKHKERPPQRTANRFGAVRTWMGMSHGHELMHHAQNTAGIVDTGRCAVRIFSQRKQQIDMR